MIVYQFCQYLHRVQYQFFEPILKTILKMQSISFLNIIDLTRLKSIKSYLYNHFYSMESKIIPDAKYQEMNMSFTFQTQEDKLVINARLDNQTYQAEKLFDSDLDFDDLKQALISKQFKMVLKTPQTLKLKIGLLNLEFKNKEKTTLQELKATISELSQKLNIQTQKNISLEKITQDLRAQIDRMSTQMSDMNQKFDQKICQITQKFLNKNEVKLEQPQKDANAKENQLNQLHKKIQSQQKAHTDIQNQLFESNKRISKVERHLFSPKIKINELAKKSKVVDTAQQQERIRLFFENKKIDTMQLLYRASENNFLVKKFHERCDGIPNTITLLKTEFNKKIGGYTPLTWQSLDVAQYSKDELWESFIFSLTHNDKFILKQNNYAIGNTKTQGPMFGGAKDLVISNEANCKYSWGLINNTYYNQNYKKDDKASFLRFHGNPRQVHTQYFETLEWEVWLINFE